MSKFRAAPRLQSEEAFIQAAEAPRKPQVTVKSAPMAKASKAARVPAMATASAVPAPSAVVDLPRLAEASDSPWEEHDQTAKATATTQPLRLNAFQYEQLKWLADNEDRSFAQILRRLVAPALEEAVRAAKHE